MDPLDLLQKNNEYHKQQVSEILSNPVDPQIPYVAPPRVQTDPNVIEGNPPPEVAARYMASQSQLKPQENTPNVGSPGPTMKYDPGVAAVKAGADPEVVAKARASMDDASYNGWCQKFVSDVAGTPRAPTAIAAWQQAKNKVQGFDGMQPGDLVYFDTTNTPGGAGHTAIYSGNGKMISGGWGERDINEWSQSMGQRPLGYVPNR